MVGRSRGIQIYIIWLVVLFAAIICILGAGSAAAVTTTLSGGKVNISSDSVSGVMGKKLVFQGIKKKVVITTDTGSKLAASKVTALWDEKGKRVTRVDAEGQITLTGQGAELTAAKATAYISSEGNTFERAVADGNVVFHGTQKTRDGVVTVADGTADHLEYVPVMNQHGSEPSSNTGIVTLISSDPTGSSRKVHLHTVKTIPPPKETPGAVPEIQDSTIAAGKLVYNLVTGVFDASGNVEMGVPMTLVKKTTKPAAKK